MTLVSLRCLAGASIPSEAMMHFSPCFRVPPISEKFLRLHRKFFPILPFPKNISDFFIRQNFWWPSFSHRSQSCNFPLYFRSISPFSSYFGKIFVPPTLVNFPTDLVKLSVFLHTFCDFRFPLLWPWCIYASHNACTGRPWCLVKECYHRWTIIYNLDRKLQIYKVLVFLPGLRPRS